MAGSFFTETMFELMALPSRSVPMPSRRAATARRERFRRQRHADYARRYEVAERRDGRTLPGFLPDGIWVAPLRDIRRTSGDDDEVGFEPDRTVWVVASPQSGYFFDFGEVVCAVCSDGDSHA